MPLLLGLELADLLNIGLLLAALAGIFLTVREVTQARKTQRAIFFTDLYTTMFGEGDVRDAFYRLEQHKFVYDPVTFHGSAEEPLIDRLLSFFDLVCDLYLEDLISRHEMAFFDYQIRRVYQNRHIQAYLGVLRTLQATTQPGLETGPFPSFIRYCERSASLNRTGAALGPWD